MLLPTETAESPAATSSLSRTDQIAIGVSVSIGVPLILLAALAWLRPTFMRRFVSQVSPAITLGPNPKPELLGTPVVEMAAGQVAIQLPSDERPAELAT